MIFIITAAGDGKRFSNAGATLPKPLIRIDGKEALLWSIQSLPLRKGDELILITRKDHQVKQRLAETIQKCFGQANPRWIEIEALTGGQADTALLADGLIEDKSAAVAIFNCDTYFECPDLAHRLEDSFDGVIPCAQNIAGDSWSFALRDETTGLAKAVAEKRRISEWASVGYYGFKTWMLFKELASSNRVESGERYIAPLYQILVDRGLKVTVPKVTGFYPFGTPEQLREFWPNARVELTGQASGKKVLVIDFDNTITIDGPESYPEKKPNLEVIRKMQECKKQGFEIVIYTSRHMKTQKNDVGRVVATVGSISMEWLKKHGVPFDSIEFGKPYAENGFYVDDRAVRPDEFMKYSVEELIKRIS